MLGLSGENRHRLLHAMQTIENILGNEPKPPSPYLLRPHEPGDFGWIIHRHGFLYSEEYGFDETFEALVAEILAQFIGKHDPKRERIWITEQDGERVGSVMIVYAGDHVAQLRLLLVEPKARSKVSASGLSTSASTSQGATATEKSGCGLRVTCWKLVIYMRKKAFNWLSKNLTPVWAMT